MRFEDTFQFEKKVFGRGVGAVTQQLDQVHQNFLRFKILMINYSTYLVEGSEEKAKAMSKLGIQIRLTISVSYRNQVFGSDTIDELGKIAQDVNSRLDVPSDEELRRLFENFQVIFGRLFPLTSILFQGHFDVFKKGRLFIRQAEVQKQNRDKLQSRILVLVSFFLNVE